MREASTLPSPAKIHTRQEALIFKAKAFLLQAKRGAENLVNDEVRAYPRTDELKDSLILAESKTELWTEKAAEEASLMAGKIQNLRVAIRKINGIEVPAGKTFSFWKHVGRATRAKGYVRGRELREGCVIPNVGGGLCQLSNALYDAALKAKFEITERHAHTQVVSGSLAEVGRDATVFWNYVDLRFRSPQAFRIEAELSADHLIIRYRAKEKVQQPSSLKKARAKLQLLDSSDPNSCMTCGVGECFRSEKPDTSTAFGATAFLVDEFMPEFDRYISDTKKKSDSLFIPLDGKRFKKANYAWATGGFKGVKQSLYETAIRSYRSRKLSAQGAARQKSLLDMARKLADSYARKLSYDQTHVAVSQNLLPFLWAEGHLGGRTFDVLMNAMPMNEIQKKLDDAHRLHPESKTLGDFRANEWLLNAEREALANARKIITPHSAIAALFPDRSELIDWKMPEAKEHKRAQNEKFTIVFPASTVGRKGCYELREALKGLDVTLITLGAQIEAKDFWEGFDVEHNRQDWIDVANLVVLPAFVEHKPRRLLLAAANGIPVIASTACGLQKVNSITNIEADAAEIRKAIEKFLK